MTAAGTRSLVSFARTLASSTQLSGALSRTDLPAEAKGAIAADLMNVPATDHAVETVVGVASGASVSRRQLVLGIVSAAADAVIGDARSNGTLERLEDELLSFSDVVKTSPELRAAFRDAAGAVDAKQGLLRDLLSGKATQETTELLSLAVAVGKPANIDEAARNFAEQAAAASGKSIAYITTAVELDDRHRNDLAQAVERSVGRPLKAKFAVDEAILGSVIVRIGNEVLDGSIAHRLSQARQKLTAVS